MSRSKNGRYRPNAVRTSSVVVRSMGSPEPSARGSRPRRRGHAQAAGPGAGWVRTDERFRDPTSKAIMRVWVDPSTDPETRYYLPDGE